MQPLATFSNLVDGGFLYVDKTPNIREVL